MVNNGDPLGSVPPNDLSIPGWPGTLWLTDRAARGPGLPPSSARQFPAISLQQLTANAGIRYYTFDNTLDGFYGFNATYSSHEGVATCFPDSQPFHGAPCADLERPKSDRLRQLRPRST